MKPAVLWPPWALALLWHQIHGSRCVLPDEVVQGRALSDQMKVGFQFGTQPSLLWECLYCKLLGAGTVAFCTSWGSPRLWPAFCEPKLINQNQLFLTCFKTYSILERENHVQLTAGFVKLFLPFTLGLFFIFHTLNTHPAPFCNWQLIQLHTRGRNTEVLQFKCGMICIVTLSLKSLKKEKKNERKRKIRLAHHN